MSDYGLLGKRYGPGILVGDWRSNMDVPGGIPMGGYTPPATLKAGPEPTGTQRTADWLRSYLPANALGDRINAVAAPVLSAFGPDYYDMGREVGRGGNPGMLAASLIPGMRPATKAANVLAREAGAAGREAVQGIRAYHGSPHDFDRFDMSKIGTGEGAQAYGHGLYFAEGEPVAQSYKGALSKDYVLRNSRVEHAPGLDGAIKTALELIDKHGSPEAAKAALPLTSDGLRAAIDKVSASGLAPYKGRMYEVNIKANPDDFLDWDKPLSQQSEKVRQALEGIGVNTKNNGEFTVAPAKSGNRWTVRNVWGEAAGHFSTREAAEAKAAEMTTQYNTGGAQLAYQRLGGETIYSRNGVDKGEASRKLNEAGIPGIRYLDQGSRTAGEGSRNYVVFDDKLVDIVRKYMAAGMSLGAAVAAAQSQLDNQPGSGPLLGQPSPSQGGLIQ